MANMVERHRISCSIYHIGAYIVKYDDGSHVVKCSSKQRCGSTCPYLNDPDYKFPHRRAPEYIP